MPLMPMLMLTLSMRRHASDADAATYADAAIIDAADAIDAAIRRHTRQRRDAFA